MAPDPTIATQLLAPRRPNEASTMPRPPKANKDKIQQQPIPVPTAVMPAANAAVAPRNVEVENFMRVRDSVSS